MKTKTAAAFLSVLILASVAAPLVSAATPETTEDGLVLQKKTRADTVYRRPEVTFGEYKKVMLAEPEVAFQKYWKSNYNLKNPRNKITDAELASMIAKGRQMLQQAFAEALTKAGYTLVDAAGPDVLAVKVSILDVEVAAPDPGNQVGAFNTTYSQGAGAATLVIELHDSTTRQVLARAFDRKTSSDKSFGWNTSRDQRTNTADASYAFRTWADMFVQGLERAKGSEAVAK
jgi:hypothetical protein